MFKYILAAILIVFLMIGLPLVIYINVTENFGFGVGILAVVFYFWLIFGGK